jgi:type IV secretion system protein VirB10
MTTTGPSDAQAPTPESKVAPDTLELRAQPRPVTRINRKVLIGAAAVVLLVIAGLVLVALRAPSLRVAAPNELFNVDHKPIVDALSKLPATYDGVQTDKKAPTGKEAPGLPKGGPHLIHQPGDAVDEADRAEKARLARLAVQAREIPGVLPLAAEASPEGDRRHGGAP